MTLDEAARVLVDAIARVQREGFTVVGTLSADISVAVDGFEDDERIIDTETLEVTR